MLFLAKLKACWPGAELCPPDLTGNGLRQLSELDPAHALVWCTLTTHELEQRPRRLGILRPSRSQQDVRLGHEAAHAVGEGHHRRLRHGRMFEQQALQLERRDPVV